MIPIKVPNVQLSSGKLPAAYRIDPVMLGNPWHGLYKVDSTDPFNTVTTLETDGGVVVDATAIYNKYVNPEAGHFVWSPPHAPGPPAWLATPNPDPTTGYHYTNYLIGWIGHGLLIPFVETDGSLGTELARHWLMHASDGRNWKVQITNWGWDSTTDTVTVSVYMTVYGTVENRDPPADKSASVSCPGGQSGQTAQLLDEANGSKSLALMGVSRDGRKALIGLTYEVFPTSEFQRAAWIGVYELSLDVLADDTTDASLSLVADRDASMGTLTSSTTEPPAWRYGKVDITSFSDPDGTYGETWNGATIVDGNLSLYNFQGVNGSRVEELRDCVLGGYYDASGARRLVRCTMRAEATHSVTETVSGGTGEIRFNADGTVQYDTRTAGTARWEGTSTGSLQATITSGEWTLTMQMNGAANTTMVKTINPLSGASGYSLDFDESWSRSYDFEGTELYSDSYSQSFVDSGEKALQQVIVVEFTTGADASNLETIIDGRLGVFTAPDGSQEMFLACAIRGDHFGVMFAVPSGYTAYGGTAFDTTAPQELRTMGVAGVQATVSWSKPVAQMVYADANRAQFLDDVGKNLHVAMHPIDGRVGTAEGNFIIGWL